jgi:hypothetical protein
MQYAVIRTLVRMKARRESPAAEIEAANVRARIALHMVFPFVLCAGSIIG